MNNKIMSRIGRICVLATTLLMATNANATPEILDWDTLTWVPEGNTNLSQTYTTGGGDITVTFGGNTADLDQAGGVISPAINSQNTGGLVPVENGLYVATDYVDNSNPMVSVTIDFVGYPGGVGNFSVSAFDMDNGGSFIDEMTVTAMTASGPINPTSMVTSVANTQTTPNTVRGVAGAGGTTSDGNVTFIFGDAGTPVSGITQITMIWRNQIGTANPGFQWINIHDFNFDDPMADVELTKSVAPTSASAGDTVVFTLDVVNNGPDTAPGVQVTDLLPAGFTYLTHSGGSYVPGTGLWDIGTLASAGTAQITIDARMEATGPWDNSAEVTRLLATDPDSTPGNNIPAEDDQDNAAVTLIAEDPIIGLAKTISVGPTNNGDGTYSLTYSFAVENYGDVALNSIQVVDDLATTFAGATGFAVDTISSADFAVNSGFDGNGNNNLLAGSDTLAIGASGTVAVAVTVTPGGTLGPYNNTSTATGTSPIGTNVNDVSQTGADPDPDGDSDPGNNSAPTPVTFGENPEIGTAKRVVATPTNNGDGSYTLTYEIFVENSGDVALSGLQIVDDMAATFAGTNSVVVDSVTSGDFAVNGTYDGNGNNNVLAGTDTLAVAASGTVSITVTVDAGGNLGVFNNTATASGTSPGGAGVSDDSESGVNPDPDGDGNPGNNSTPTPISFTESPLIGVAKSITTGPTNNGDGTHTLTYTLTVENFGDVPLNSVQVIDNLASTFSGATGFIVDSVSSGDFAVSGTYNGNGDNNLLTGTDTMATGATGTIALTVTVTPGGTLGPYDNSATATGRSPANSLTIDNSVDGLDPDPDGNGDPVDNVSPTPVTFGENPEIGTAKRVVATPTNNGDGSYTLTYEIFVENSGDVALSGLQIVDDMAATFAGTNSVVVDSVTSGDFAVNGTYDGNGNNNVLAGTDTLAVAASGTVSITVTVDAGGNLGVFNNTATASGTSPGGAGVSDDSESGVNPDPDGDGNPGNNSTPTPISFTESPLIGVAKSITTGPTNNGDGTHTLTYTLTVENFGDVPLNSVQVIDNLASTFSGATGFIVDSVSSGDFAVSGTYNGNGDNNLLTGTDTMATGATGTIALTVTVTPGGTLGPYDNSATATGRSPANSLTIDNSVDGLDPDPDGNGDPVDNVSPTPVTFGENPEIGTAKSISAGPTNNGDGTFTLTYSLFVENSGDVSLNGVQLVDDLAATYAGATGFVVDSVTSGDFAVNGTYDGNGNNNVLAGTDTLNAGANGAVAITVTVTPGATLGPYNNTSTASGTSPAGTGVNDVSQAGLDPDPDGDGNPGNNSDPTPVTFGEMPQIGTAKQISAGPTNNGDGTHTLTYDIFVENTGDVLLSSVQVVDDLAATFAGTTGFVVDSVISGDFAVNGAYDGNGNNNLLAGTDTLVVAASGNIAVTVTVTPGTALGPFNNVAASSGTSPAGTGVNDASQLGVNPDPDGDGNPGNNSDPTPVTFAENPEIGTAKSISAGPTNNGDGTFTLTYSLLVENSGDVPLSGIQLVDDLAATYAGATGFVVDSVTSGDFAVNGTYDGNGNNNVLAGTDTLAIGASGSVLVTVTVTPGATLGPYNNTSTANGLSPAGTGVNDVSQSGVNPDPDGDGDPGNNSDPTPVTFGEMPQIGTAKALTAGPTNNGDGTFTLSYSLFVENTGDVTLSNVQVTDDLATVYAAAAGFTVDTVTSADFAVNGAYDGNANTNLLAGTDSLTVGASGTLVLTITVTPGASLGPYDNVATATGQSPAATVVSDIATDGADPDPDGDGNPGNNSDPTPVTFGENPVIGTAKTISAGPTNNGDGTFTLTYSLLIENSGDVALNNVQLTDDLAATYAGATGFVVDSVTSGDFAVNGSYDGNGINDVLAGTDTLAIGASGTVLVTVTVTPGATLGPYNNTSTATGMSPAGTGVNDVSQSGVNPDPDGDGNPGNNSDPTPVTFAENPEIGTAKSISAGPTNNGDGTFTLTYSLFVENSGDVALSGVQLFDDLATTFAGATSFVADSVTSGDLTVDPAYDGNGNNNLLAGTDTLATGASGTVLVTVTVTPGATLGPYNNSSAASGTSPAGTGVNDISQAGVNPDPDGDGDPGNNSDPTPVTFGEMPQIGTAKALTAGPTNNGDGTFTLSYSLFVENTGDVTLSNVQVTDDLATVYAAAAGFTVDTVTSADFAVNGAYDGNANTNLLAGTDSLTVGASGTLVLTITVTPGASLGPYDNVATATGQSPAATVVSDIATDGADPDPDGDGNPGNNSDPTPVTFGENPVIGTAKTISAGPTNNGDGTFTLTYSLLIENSGDVALNNVQLTDDLAATYAGATGFVVDSVTSGDFAVNGSYDGNGINDVLAGTDTLAIGASGTALVTVTVTPGATLGPYNNTSTATGMSPAGTGVNDVSQSGVNPDPDGDGNPGNNSDPTPVTFGEMPEIGTAKVIASTPVNNGDGTFTLTYTLFVENTGDVALTMVQINDNLATTFAGASAFVVDLVSSATLTVNSAYDGDTDDNVLAGVDSLLTGTSGSVDITVTVTTGGNAGPYDNVAVATGQSPTGTVVSDVATDGTDPDPGGDGPADDNTPTTITFGVAAALEGNAWLDQDIDDLFDGGEPPLEGWIIEVVQNGVVIATVPVNPDGSYSVSGLAPGTYDVVLRNPANTAVFGTLANINLPAGLTVIDQNLPIDPSGIVYDSQTRQPVPGVTVTLLDSMGNPLPAACLLGGQQNQVVGADGLYRFDLILGADAACMSGDTFDIVFTNPAGYVPGISTMILPTPGPFSASGNPDPFQVQLQAGAPMGGDSTLYYLSFLVSNGDPNIINNHIPIDPIAPAANLLVSKRADRRATVVGDLIIYTVTVQNPGAAISGLTLSDQIPPGFSYVAGSARLQPAAGVTATGQRPVLFSNIDVAAGGTTELRYMLRVGAGVVQGDYVNTVTPMIGATVVGNVATATVTVTADPDFEQTSVVGMVFNDANGNGWQDDGEGGIPGVRLATVEGLIIETDAFGRYHIAGVDGGRRDRGRNFIIKVDQSSLPDGVSFTTENPRVQRITEGLMNRFDFGVNLPSGDDACCDQIDVKIGEVFFEDGSSDIRTEFFPLIRQLADRLMDHRGGTLYIEGHAEPSEAVAYSSDAYTVTQYFGPRSAKLSADDKRELDAIIARWRGVENVSVSAIGHTCDTPIAMKNRHEFKDNYALARARAQAVASYVRLGLGIAPEQVSVTGKGPDQPIASNATPEGGAKNRRVELTINGQRQSFQSSEADLARDRANRIYNELRKLMGDDLIRNINITSDAAPEKTEQESEMTSHTKPGWLSKGAGTILGLLINSAHAESMPASCTVDSCNSDAGYVMQIVPSSTAPSPNDTRAALADNKRVDISGRFSVPVAGGGVLWATEDPTAGQPRMAAHGPDVAPAANGSLASPVSFFVYSNYAAFVTKAEVQIYHGEDIDLIEPLAVLPFKPGVFSRIDWQGTSLSRSLQPGDELYYRVRVYDADGRYDETHLDSLRLLSEADFANSDEAHASALLPQGSGIAASTRSALGPLDGNVLVLQPPRGELKKTRSSYRLTPHFDSRKTVLKAQDKAELNKIIAQWKNAEEIRIHVVGHTDNVRIAPQNRKEFANNQVLSEARARVVADYVANKLGIDRMQTKAEGMADKQPVASNATAAGRAENRRVELTISGMQLAQRSAGLSSKTLVEPHSNTTVKIGNTLDEALNLISSRTGDSASSATSRRYADPDMAQSSGHTLAAIYGQNNLRYQRIPVNGSRVRINGQDIAGNLGLRINGDPVPLDSNGRYAVEYLMPVGSHNYDVELVNNQGSVTQRSRLPVEVSGEHIFLVALADLTLSDNNVSGSIEPTSGDNRYDDDMLVEGRLAFYLKGKIKGKYLVTAQMDSQEEEIGDLFGNLFDKDPRSVLRRLDPDRYYPVYGDDSTTINDTDSQGRLYLRVDWDRSRATWGNFHTGLTGNEFAQYNRSLYGAQYQHESLNITGKGVARTNAVAFASEAQTAFGHSEFRGTGGSLYYLKHQDILPGSEKAWIEVRDRDSDRVRDLVTLVRGMDYEVDEIQGRIILSRPLMQISGLHAPGIIKDSPLDGDDMVLLVDYEYLPIGFNADKITLGASGKHWITDDFAIGGTIVDENRSGEDYGLMGADILWQPGEGTYVKAEFARSEASQADRFLSADGGLTFDTAAPTALGREGDAWSVEARVNSREAWDTENVWVGGAWYRRTDDNFSVARRDPGVDTTEYGLELTMEISPRMDLSARASVVERENLDEDRRLSLQADYRMTDRSSLSGEIRSVEEQRLGSKSDGMLVALRYSYALTDAIDVYGIGQVTLDNDSGRYDNNDMGTIGARVDLGRTSIQGEYSSGHRGEGALLNLDYRLNDRHQVYGTFTQSVDSTDLREPGTKIALGHRSRISDQATLFNERQFVEDRGQSGIAHVFGLDYELSTGWAFGLSVQQGDLQTELGNVDRDAATVTANYRGEKLNWRGKAEMRDESGISEIDQILFTNRLDLKLSDSLRLLSRFNHSETDDQTPQVVANQNARFTEAGIGLAYRPVENNRLNMLAKYTYLYDLPAPLQVDGGTDQRSHIVALEGIYRLNPKWELGGKLAQRSGELRTDRDSGQWFESTTNFAAVRARYHLINRWDGMLEYRTIDVDEANSSRDGWLIALDRHVNDHFRLGLGYNFTDFSDDLTNLDYDHKGWFINAIGKY